MANTRKIKRTRKNIISLEDNLASAKNKIVNLERQLGKQEHYSRLNCFLSRGTPETKEEQIDSIAISIICEHLNENLTLMEFHRLHRIGKFDLAKANPKPVL